MTGKAIIVIYTAHVTNFLLSDWLTRVMNINEGYNERYISINNILISFLHHFSETPVIYWKKLNGNLPPLWRMEYQKSNTLLIIKNLLLSDAGVYQCSAQNSAGTASSDIEVVVDGKYNTKINLSISGN